MAENPHYRQHVHFGLNRAAALVTQWTDKTLAALRTSSSDIALAHDRHVLFQLIESLQNQRYKLETTLAQHIRQEIEACGPATPATLNLNNARLDQLTLVDESEAEREIEISRTVQLIDLQAEWEWRELQAFSATLLGETRLRPEANPFRPAVFAKALSTATVELGLSPVERKLLLRIGAKVLADVLRAFYAQLCDRLTQLGMSPLAYRTVTTPQRPRVSDVNVTQPGALHSLLERIPQHQLMGAGLSAPVVSASLDHALHHLRTASPSMPPAPRPTQGDPQTMALLSRLFEQMVKDDELQAPVRQVIERLQPTVLRSALHDPSLLRGDQHPAWRLLNRVASYANGHSDQDQVGQSTFLGFLEPLIQRLAQSPAPQALQYEQALAQVQSFIDQQTHAKLQPSRQAVAELEAADHRQVLRPLLRQQVAHQLAATKVSDRIKDFLRGPWVDVLAHNMATHGEDSEEAQAMLATVDDLLHSLQRPTTSEERQALRQALPGLIQRLQQGMALIDMPQGQRDAILDELMILHTRYLRPQGKAEREPTPEELVRQLREEMVPDEVPFEHALHRQVLDTHVGSLPTVPMSFGDDAQNGQTDTSASEWIDSLQKGCWCKLFLQGKWTSAHLLWFSDNRQFFMFASDHEGGRHSLTRRALERLRAEGLATSLEERNLMQRAVDSLLQDLDTDTGPI